MAKARLYLDFDGVINADKPRFDDVETFTISIPQGYGLVKTYKIVYSPTVVKTLTRLVDEYDVEIVWDSTWNENLEVLKLPPLLGGLFGGRVINVVLNRNVKTNREWTAWKAKGILDDQKNDVTPFLWVDDEAHEYHAKDLLKATEGTPSLLIAPRTYWGLTKNDLVLMENFLKGLN